jgi:hypothetical protein
VPTTKPGTVFKGFLHDVNTTAGDTDRGQEPRIDDEECWVQYCVTEIESLGPKMLFIEFVFDYTEWGGQQDAIDRDIIGAGRVHA